MVRDEDTIVPGIIITLVLLVLLCSTFCYVSFQPQKRKRTKTHTHNIHYVNNIMNYRGINYFFFGRMY